MGYGEIISIDVYSVGRKKKVGCIYDSEVQQPGAVFNINRNREMNGWKELKFTLPVMVNGEENWRLPLMTNEYEIRVTDGDDVDWYRLSQPEDTDDGITANVEVTCPHCSVNLKKRNIYLAFTDENGIGTIREIAERALDGTGWT